MKSFASRLLEGLGSLLRRGHGAGAEDWGLISPKLEAVRRSLAFEALAGADLLAVTRNLEEERVPAGAVLLVEGRLNHSFYLLVEGVCEVSLGGARTALLHPGDFFGESSHVRRGAALATVRAITPVRLLVANQERYAAIHPHIRGRSLARVAARREQGIRDRVRESQQAHPLAAASRHPIG